MTKDMIKVSYNELKPAQNSMKAHTFTFEAKTHHREIEYKKRDL